MIDSRGQSLNPIRFPVFLTIQYDRNEKVMRYSLPEILIFIVYVTAYYDRIKPTNFVQYAASCSWLSLLNIGPQLT